MADTTGLHHVTAIAGDPQRNVTFYAHVLGLRLVKRTVNFDAPHAYHLYYGDACGTPGSLLTFFPFPQVRPGRRGAGQATTTAFSVPEGSLGWWHDHLTDTGTQPGAPSRQGDEERLTFHDPDGLAIDLVAHTGPDPRSPWDSPVVPAEHAVRGLHSSVLSVADPAGTVELLSGDLGMRLLSQTASRVRLTAGDGAPGTLIDLLVDPGSDPGLVAGGTVHHVALRVPDEQTQLRWRAELVERGYEVTAVLDRQYFRSIYFREPAGTLLELATDTPGFVADEPLPELGLSLKLPPWLEPDRERIGAALPAIEVPVDNDPLVSL